MSVQRAREAAARGGWEEAYDLLAEADTNRSGRSSAARRGRLRGRPSRRDHRGLGARVRAVRTGRRPCRGGRCSGSRRDAPAAGHRAHGAGARLARRADAFSRVMRRRPRTRGSPPSARTSGCLPATSTALGSGPSAPSRWARARRCGVAIGRVAAARVRILDGDVEEGLALLDEVGVAAVSGDLDPLSTGLVYCELVCALQGLAQYDVAEEWTEAMERWCRTNAVGSLRGRCRVHRAEILRLRGACDEAEREALTACEELSPYLRRETEWPLASLDGSGCARGTSRAPRRRSWLRIALGGSPSRVSRLRVWRRETRPRRPVPYATRWTVRRGPPRRNCDPTRTCSGRPCSRRRSR